MDGALSIDQVFLGEEPLAAGAVQSGVGPLLERVRIRQLLPQRLDRRPVHFLIRRADEDVGGNPQTRVQVFEERDVAVNECFGRQLLLLRRLLDLDAMLIRADL
jgi:hypothetical protein